jgi:glycosyltransferase involved in cell wall biosynthesis
MSNNNLCITVFTPTYNRSHCLMKLYSSLCSQTFKNFEWLIVDDGSIDDTELLVEKLKQKNEIVVRYYKQSNRGKHIAINTSLSLAKGEYFFIVDSDDYLVENALDIVYQNIQSIQNNSKVCGLVFNRINNIGKTIGGDNKYNKLECSLYDLKFKYHLNSDKAEIFKTDILKFFLFPVIQKEKFCPEALVMFKMSGSYNIVYLNTGIYVCEYLLDGLTSKITRLRMNNPNYSCMYYDFFLSISHNTFLKIKSAINFFRFYYCGSKIKPTFNSFFYLFKPLGFLAHKLDEKIK